MNLFTFASEKVIDVDLVHNSLLDWLRYLSYDWRFQR